MRAPHSSASLTLRYLGTDPEERAPRPPKWFSLQALSPLRPGWRRVAPAKLLPKQLFFGGAGTRLPASLRCEVSTQPPESRPPRAPLPGGALTCRGIRLALAAAASGRSAAPEPRSTVMCSVSSSNPSTEIYQVQRGRPPHPVGLPLGPGGFPHGAAPQGLGLVPC